MYFSCQKIVLKERPIQAFPLFSTLPANLPQALPLQLRIAMAFP
jgi:hypothetical protein